MVRTFVALAGGVGAAKFLRGLVRVIDPSSLYVIGNVGDNIWIFDLYVAPDLDIVTYALADVWDEKRGWGIKGEGFQVRDALRAIGLSEAEWFNLGDKDFATCIYRTILKRKGLPLSSITDTIRSKFGVKSKIIPSTDQDLVTQVHTAEGWISFEEYYVKHASRPPIDGLRFAGSEAAEPAPGVLEAIYGADKIIVCPSNPVASIQPILAVRGILEALKQRRERVLAISPLIGGKAIKGPADSMMHQLGYDPSVAGLVKLYREFVSTFVIDTADALEGEKISLSGDVKIRATNTLMATLEDSVRLAREVLEA